MKLFFKVIKIILLIECAIFIFAMTLWILSKDREYSLYKLITGLNGLVIVVMFLLLIGVFIFHAITDKDE